VDIECIDVCVNVFPKIVFLKKMYIHTIGSYERESRIAKKLEHGFKAKCGNSFIVLEN
jgi:hypothetical protein